MKAQIKDFVITLERKRRITLETDEQIESLYEELRDHEVDVKIAQHREKRSKDENAYCWTLIHKLADVLKQDAIDVYRHYVRNSGVCRVFDIEEKAAATIEHLWGLNGLGWVCDVLDYGKTDGYKTIRAFYGSSTYNTAQMSRLIDSIVEDCKENNIETLPPDKIAEMKAGWESEK